MTASTRWSRSPPRRRHRRHRRRHHRAEPAVAVDEVGGLRAPQPGRALVVGPLRSRRVPSSSSRSRRPRRPPRRRRVRVVVNRPADGSTDGWTASESARRSADPLEGRAPWRPGLGSTSASASVGGPSRRPPLARATPRHRPAGRHRRPRRRRFTGIPARRGHRRHRHRRPRQSRRRRAPGPSPSRARRRPSSMSSTTAAAAASRPLGSGRRRRGSSITWTIRGGAGTRRSGHDRSCSLHRRAVRRRSARSCSICLRSWRASSTIARPSARDRFHPRRRRGATGFIT